LQDASRINSSQFAVRGSRFAVCSSRFAIHNFAGYGNQTENGEPGTEN
jgi:hypothetical protein